MRFRELQRILTADGWRIKGARVSHSHYIHPTKPGKLTVPCHPGDLSPNIVRLILKQAGIQQH